MFERCGRPTAERAPHKHITAEHSRTKPKRHMSQPMTTLHGSSLFSASFDATRFVKAVADGPVPALVDHTNDANVACSMFRIRSSQTFLFTRS